MWTNKQYWRHRGEGGPYTPTSLMTWGTRGPMPTLSPRLRIVPYLCIGFTFSPSVDFHDGGLDCNVLCLASFPRQCNAEKRSLPAWSWRRLWQGVQKKLRRVFSLTESAPDDMLTSSFTISTKIPGQRCEQARRWGLAQHSRLQLHIGSSTNQNCHQYWLGELLFSVIIMSLSLSAFPLFKFHFLFHCITVVNWISSSDWKFLRPSSITCCGCSLASSPMSKHELDWKKAKNTNASKKTPWWYG